MQFVFTIFTFISTLLGGLTGVKLRDRLHLILGFTAGVLVAVVAFDIFPELFSLVQKNNLVPRNVMTTLIVGFLMFHILEKLLLIHHAQEDRYGEHKHPAVGVASALALSGHSFLDGVGIGLAFQVSSGVGILVALAVISHDFSDGLNTVSLMLLNRNSVKRSISMLLLDATTPLLGVLSTNFIHLSDRMLAYYLAFFAGFLLYIGASEILPEAHSQFPSLKTLGMTLAGVSFIYIVTLFV